MTEGSSTAGIRPPDYLLPPQIFFHVAGSHENCITIINQADDLEDYTGPQEVALFRVCLRYASLNITCYFIVLFTD